MKTYCVCHVQQPPCSPSEVVMRSWDLHLLSLHSGSPLPGAHGRGPLLGVRPAVVLPPSLWGMQAVCVRRLWRQREPVLLEGRVPELVRRAKVKPVRPQLELGGSATPSPALSSISTERAASGRETSVFVHKCVKCWIYLYISKPFCCKFQCECSKPFFQINPLNRTFLWVDSFPSSASRKSPFLRSLSLKYFFKSCHLLRHICSLWQGASWVRLGARWGTHGGAAAEVSPSAAAGGIPARLRAFEGSRGQEVKFQGRLLSFTFSEQLQGFVFEPASFLLPLKERRICHQLSSREY